MSQIFSWEWNERLPLRAIVDEAKKTRGIPYVWDDGSTCTNLIFAKSPKDAQKQFQSWLIGGPKVYLKEIRKLS